MVTIILPVSRDYYLKRIFTQLELLKCNSEEVSILTYVDGPLTLFEPARNFTVKSKFKEKLCVFRKRGTPNVGSVKRRRQRIADIHNEIKDLIAPTDYVFLIEDDTLLPTNALQKLLDAYTQRPNAGIISGVQIGRWGFDHIGAWTFDDVYSPNKAVSIPAGEGLVNVDATGLYCCLTKYKYYKEFRFEPFEEALGPDVAFGIHLRRQGYTNFADHSVKCDHLTKRGVINFNRTIVQVELNRLENNQWSQGLFSV